MKFKLNYKDLGIAAKLLLFVLPLVILLVFALGYVSSTISKETLTKTISENLQNIANLKVSKLEDFYKRTYDNVSLLQNNEEIKENLSFLVNNYKDSSDQKTLEGKDAFIRSFVKTYGYHCLKLINKDGYVVYATGTDRILGTRIGDPDDKAFIYGQEDIFFSEIFKADGIHKMVVSAPIFYNNQLIGVIAMELNMASTYDFVQDATGLGETGETLLGRKTSSGALFLNPLRHDANAALNKEAKTGSVNATPVLKAVNGNASVGIFNDYRGEEVIAVSRFVPSFKWGLVAKIDTKEAFKPITNITKNITVVSLIMLAITSILSLLFARYIVRPIVRLKNTIAILGQGNLVEEKLVKGGSDEIGDMIDATNFLTDFLKNIVAFAKHIGDGNFDIETNIDETKGVLGSSLTTMSTNLQEVAKADEKRNWATVGLAKFADILRSRDEKLESLTDTINSNLIKYLNANQGSIFVVNDEGNESFLELTASYAWDRKKHKKKEILLGEGLAGRCWQEAETIYLTDIPEDYITITSGLGEANPRSILLVPMKIEEKVFGIIEIASFNEIGKYQIEFVEKLAESIASTISNTKTNLQTAYLLEESKEMTEELRAQEEEMRQNMEEMQATQEEMGKVTEEKDKVIMELREEIKSLKK